MSNQAPLAHPMHFANGQDVQYGHLQGAFMPPLPPPGMPLAQPPFIPPFLPHPPYPHPMSLVPNPYGQLQAYMGPVNPAHIPNQQDAQPPLGPSQAPAPAPRNRPNREVRPGVFAFQIDVLHSEERETFNADTEMPWLEFRDRVVRVLGDPQEVQLAGKVSGEGGWGILNGAEGLGRMMQRIVQKAYNARTKVVGLEVKNTAKLLSKKSKSKGKRSRKEDVPPATESDSENNSQFIAYKQLSEETRCEAHHGHCHITRQGGFDNHHRLSHQEMTLWAKKMSLNEATKYAPPHCLNFDCGPTLKSGRRTPSASSVPEVHVTIQNIAPDGSFLPSSATPPVVSSSASGVADHHVATLPSVSSELTSTPTASPSMYQPSNPSISAPSQQTHINPSALSWGTPIAAISGKNIFPPLSSVIALLAFERPGPGWIQIGELLWEAGVTSSEHILLADPTVLALVGNMGQQQATVLRNYAKRVVLPVLGLQGSYQEDENVNEDTTSAPPTRKRALDLGESVVRGLYKKPKFDDIVNNEGVEMEDEVSEDSEDELYSDSEDDVEDDVEN